LDAGVFFISGLRMSDSFLSLYYVQTPMHTPFANCRFDIFLCELVPGNAAVSAALGLNFFLPGNTAAIGRRDAGAPRAVMRAENIQH
jgi:hypothetical protein